MRPTRTAAVMNDFNENKDRFVSDIEDLMESGASESKIWEAYKIQHGVMRGYLECMSFVLPHELWEVANCEYNQLRREMRKKVTNYVYNLQCDMRL